MTESAAPSLDFVRRLLRDLRRAGHCSGIRLTHGTRKRYGDVIRMIEKREARDA